jgi:hypothetical protein
MTIRILDAINSAPPLSVVVDVPGAGSSRMPNMTRWPRVNTALLLLVLVGGEGAVKPPVRRSVWCNREDTDA